jgi:prepilin-type N-terminal cleavage/methylation domain-containing protein
MTKKVSPKTSRGFRRGERLTNCSRDRCGRRYNAFTLIELIVVVSIIAVLGALVLSTAGYARKKGARARAETEIAAMAAACENYKADKGIYPRSSTTDTFTAVTNRVPPDPQPTSYDPSVTAYSFTSFYLYGQLSGNPSGDRITYTQQRYFQFKANMLSPPDGTSTVTAIRDPFGNSYGYSTAQAFYVDNPVANPNYGFNPTFDLWSTGGTFTVTDAAYENVWLKNW